ncbi:MAG TPA: alginate lyase family protein [Acidobacteriaceae bacterium]
MRRYLAGLVVLGWVAMAGAQTQPYALVSPGMAAQMKGLGASEAARKIMSAAGGQAKATPTPMAHVHTEGTLPHQGIRDESIVAERDWDRMLNLGLAYRLSGGDRKYLQGEAKFLAAWMGMYKADLNPIDETRLDTVFMAFDLTRADLPAKVQADTLALFATMADGYLAFVEKHPCGKQAENWQSHRIKLATLAAYELGDAARIARAKTAFETQVGCNVRADGSVEDFYKRDALHYVAYDLEPLLTTALAAKAHGEDWFHWKAPSGSSVAGAVDWLLPYASGAKTHEEFVHSSVSFDAARDKAGEKGYSGLWDAKGGVTTLALAAAADAKYAEPSRRLNARVGAQSPVWIQLLTSLKP